MVAETALSVINALPESEKERLFKMLDRKPKVKTLSKKDEQIEHFRNFIRNR